MLILFIIVYKALVRKLNLRFEFKMESKVNLILMKLSDYDMDIGVEMCGMFL